jgi:CubicO group peptidase (beta-lactamase class C family)
MRVTPREQLDSRSELVRRCRLVAISVVSVLAIAACGGGGGGGGGGDNGGAQQPPPPPANVAPTVQAGTDQTIEWPTNSANLTGSATDDSSTSTLTYTWSATSGPAGVTFATANAAATSVTFPSAGNYVLQLSVSDGSASGTDTVAVTVSPAMYPATDTNADTNYGWTRVAAAADVGMDQALLTQAETYASTSGTATVGDNAGMIVRHGRIVHSWGLIDKRYDLKSTTKSMGGIALGLAIDDGTIALSDIAQTRLPTIGALPASNAGTGWLGEITIQQLATHTAGFLKRGEYEPAGVNPTLIYRPGTTWSYSDNGLNWLSETLTAVFGQDLATVLNTEVWTVLGVNSSAGGAGNVGPATSDVHWRDNVLRPQGGTIPHNRELASGIYANSNAMARVGLLFLREGVWANDQRVLSESFIETVKTPPAANAALPNANEADYPGATVNYGVLWWTNATGLLPNVPRDAYWAWGLGDSVIVVIPSLDIVAVRAGRQAAADSSLGVRVWNDDDWNGDYSLLAPFLDPIVQSVTP